MRVLTRTGVAFAVTALAVPAIALAGGDLGTAGGVSYVKDSASPTPPATAVLEAACPAGKQVSGGGFDAWVNGELNDSAPADGPDGDPDPDDAWFVSVDFAPGGFEPEVAAYAICEGRSHRPEVQAETVAAGATETVSAPCPGKTKPIGGGVSLSGAEDEAHVNSSYPFDGPDADSDPDDGWRGRAHNAAGAVKTMTVTAICRGGALRNRFRFWDVPVGEATFPPCLDTEHLVGIGWRITGPASEGFPEYGTPSDDSDTGSAPDDGADFAAHHDGSAPKRLIPHAICDA